MDFFLGLIPQAIKIPRRWRSGDLFADRLLETRNYKPETIIPLRLCGYMLISFFKLTASVP